MAAKLEAVQQQLERRQEQQQEQGQQQEQEQQQETRYDTVTGCITCFRAYSGSRAVGMQILVKDILDRGVVFTWTSFEIVNFTAAAPADFLTTIVRALETSGRVGGVHTVFRERGRVALHSALGR